MTALDAIQLGARSLHTVIISYTDVKGQSTTREVEPYSLRPGAQASTRFFGFDVTKQQIRGFRLDRVASATVTGNAYTPRWVVEL